MKRRVEMARVRELERLSRHVSGTTHVRYGWGALPPLVSHDLSRRHLKVLIRLPEIMQNPMMLHQYFTAVPISPRYVTNVSG